MAEDKNRPDQSQGEIVIYQAEERVYDQGLHDGR